ncbi:glycosyltransferase family 4 protein, partial [bacterium]
MPAGPFRLHEGDRPVVGLQRAPQGGERGGEPVKILHTAQIHWYNAEVQYAYDLAEAMAKMGHEVHILTRKNTLSAQVAKERGFRVFEEDGFNAKGVGFWKVFAAGHRLKLLLRRERYDAVLVHRPEGLPLIALAGKLTRTPVVRVRGDMRPVRSDPLNRYVYKKLLSGVVASNLAIEKNLRERIGGIENLATIHGGVSLGEFSDSGPAVDLGREHGFAPDAFLVGLLGRLGEVKGHIDFLDAAKIAYGENPRLGFFILAKNLNENAVLRRIKARLEGDSDLQKAVRLVGRQDNLPATLRAFDLGVIASTGSEANCRVGLEWMACGRPILT